MERYYSVHDIVTFKVVDSTALLGRLLPSWDSELRDMESPHEAEPDFTVYVGRFRPHLAGCRAQDDDFYLAEGRLYCRDRVGWARWQLEISGLDGGAMEVRIWANPWGLLQVCELIVNPLVWYVLNRKGFAVCHGSGVARDGQAFVFAGRGGSGKTTIALDLVRRGYRLLGDHFVILNGGDVLGLPAPLHLMGFNAGPLVAGGMTARQRLLLRANGLLHRATGKEIATKVSPRALFPGSLQERARLHSAFLLLPRGHLGVEGMDREGLVAHMVANQWLESLPFTRYMMEYSYLFPQSPLASHWTRYEENVRQALDSLENCYRVEVPHTYDAETLDEIAGMVAGLAGRGDEGRERQRDEAGCQLQLP